MICYKVVTSNRNSIYAKGSYCVKYPVGALVRAKEGTLGLMVFPEREDAEWFQHDIISANIILKVEVCGEGIVPEFISEGITGSSLDLFYLGGLCSTSPPIGTECYRELRVLE